MANSSSFSKAWRHISKRSSRRNRKEIKNTTNRANRRNGKELLDYAQPKKHSSWDVT